MDFVEDIPVSCGLQHIRSGSSSDGEFVFTIKYKQILCHSYAATNKIIPAAINFSISILV